MGEIKFRAWDGQQWLSHDIISRHSVVGQLPDTKDISLQIWYKEKDITICLSTGLKDKNGTEIYEGDIVEDGYHAKYGIYAVRWVEDGARWNFNSTDGRELVILGNTYETPDPLTTQEEGTTWSVNMRKG